MRAVKPALLAQGRPGPLAPALGFAFASAVISDDRSGMR
jgi:hypothetical protein